MLHVVGCAAAIRQPDTIYAGFSSARDIRIQVVSDHQALLWLAMMLLQNEFEDFSGWFQHSDFRGVMKTFHQSGQVRAGKDAITEVRNTPQIAQHNNAKAPRKHSEALLMKIVNETGFLKGKR